MPEGAPGAMSGSEVMDMIHGGSGQGEDRVPGRHMTEADAEQQKQIDDMDNLGSGMGDPKKDEQEHPEKKDEQEAGEGAAGDPEGTAEDAEGEGDSSDEAYDDASEKDDSPEGDEDKGDAKASEGMKSHKEQLDDMRKTIEDMATKQLSPEKVPDAKTEDEKTGDETAKRSVLQSLGDKIALQDSDISALMEESSGNLSKTGFESLLNIIIDTMDKRYIERTTAIIGPHISSVVATEFAAHQLFVDHPELAPFQNSTGLEAQRIASDNPGWSRDKVYTETVKNMRLKLQFAQDAAGEESGGHKQKTKQSKPTLPGAGGRKRGGNRPAKKSEFDEQSDAMDEFVEKRGYVS